MKFSKIKCSAGEVVLHWTTTENGQSIDHKLESFATPAPELPAALQDFAPFVLKLCGLSEAWPLLDGTLTVASISVNTENDDRRGLVITSLKKLEHTNAPLVLNTPHLRESLDEQTDGAAGFLLDGMLDAIEHAEKCATRYVNGVRDQRELFDAAPAATRETETVPA